MYSRSERNNHDRGRSTLRERARKHFFGQKKEIEHELNQNRTLIKKFMNDGYRFETVLRLENQYEVRFIHPVTADQKECIFNYESNFNTLETMWQTTAPNRKA